PLIIALCPPLWTLGMRPPARPARARLSHVQRTVRSGSGCDRRKDADPLAHWLSRLGFIFPSAFRQLRPHGSGRVFRSHRRSAVSSARFLPDRSRRSSSDYERIRQTDGLSPYAARLGPLL